MNKKADQKNGNFETPFVEYRFYEFAQSGSVRDALLWFEAKREARFLKEILEEKDFRR